MPLQRRRPWAIRARVVAGHRHSHAHPQTLLHVPQLRGAVHLVHLRQHACAAGKHSMFVGCSYPRLVPLAIDNPVPSLIPAVLPRPQHSNVETVIVFRSLTPMAVRPTVDNPCQPPSHFCTWIHIGHLPHVVRASRSSPQPCALFCCPCRCAWRTLCSLGARCRALVAPARWRSWASARLCASECNRPCETPVGISV